MHGKRNIFDYRFRVGIKLVLFIFFFKLPYWVCWRRWTLLGQLVSSLLFPPHPSHNISRLTHSGTRRSVNRQLVCSVSWTQDWNRTRTHHAAHGYSYGAQAQRSSRFRSCLKVSVLDRDLTFVKLSLDFCCVACTRIRTRMKTKGLLCVLLDLLTWWVNRKKHRKHLPLAWPHIWPYICADVACKVCIPVSVLQHRDGWRRHQYTKLLSKFKIKK